MRGFNPTSVGLPKPEASHQNVAHPSGWVSGAKVIMISVSIIGHNEEKNIERCLESVKWADEIIVVDSGSTDKTVEIAVRFGAKVFENQWQGYGAQKNFAIDKASNNWILSIDADEVVTDELKEEIRGIIKNSAGYAAFKIPRMLYFQGRLMKWSGADYQIRLFLKGRAKFDLEPVHEKLLVDGDIGKFKNSIIHYSYENLTDYFNRFNRYTSLDARKRYQKGARFNLWHCILPFHKFISMYFLKLGFLDGRQGLDWAVLCAFYDIVKFMKLRELQNEKK